MNAQMDKQTVLLGRFVSIQTVVIGVNVYRTGDSTPTDIDVCRSGMVRDSRLAIKIYQVGFLSGFTYHHFIYHIEYHITTLIAVGNADYL